MAPPPPMPAPLWNPISPEAHGGGFSLGRMSWLKPNFLWMIYRSGWGTKENQQVTLAVRLRRDAFDETLRQAVHSSFVPELYGSEDARRRAVAGFGRAATMVPGSRTVGESRPTAGDPAWAPGRGPGPLRQGLTARCPGHLRLCA
jgi:hypothetical protein